MLCVLTLIAGELRFTNEPGRYNLKYSVPGTADNVVVPPLTIKGVKVVTQRLFMPGCRDGFWAFCVHSGANCEPASSGRSECATLNEWLEDDKCALQLHADRALRRHYGWL